MEICGQEPAAVQFSQKFWKFRKDFVRGNKEMSGGCVAFRVFPDEEICKEEWVSCQTHNESLS